MIQIQIAKYLAQVGIIMIQVGHIIMGVELVIQAVAPAQVIQAPLVQLAKVVGI